jgi:hypothetical protein
MEQLLDLSVVQLLASLIFEENLFGDGMMEEVSIPPGFSVLSNKMILNLIPMD